MKEWGGYLPLELPRKSEYFSFVDENSIVRLNCGRSTIWYALRNIQPKKLYVPYLNCQNSTDPAEWLNVPYEYYRLNEDLTPSGIHPASDEAVLWVNYYGNAGDETAQKVWQSCGGAKLIIDNCHCFFRKPVEYAYNCYSARKFFGVCDGAYLIKTDLQRIDLPESRSADYAGFLLRTIEDGTNACYLENLKNEERIANTVSQMSPLTHRILSSIDYDSIYQIRKKIWKHCTVA